MDHPPSGPLFVGLTDEFMRAVDKDELFELKHPKFGVVRKIKAKKLWHFICKNAHATGDPGILFVDNINNISYQRSLNKSYSSFEQSIPVC